MFKRDDISHHFLLLQKNLSENTNSKGDFILKNRFYIFILKISDFLYTKINQIQIWYVKFN